MLPLLFRTKEGEGLSKAKDKTIISLLTSSLIPTELSS